VRLLLSRIFLEQVFTRKKLKKQKAREEGKKYKEIGYVCYKVEFSRRRRRIISSRWIIFQQGVLFFYSNKSDFRGFQPTHNLFTFENFTDKNHKINFCKFYIICLSKSELY